MPVGTLTKLASKPLAGSGASSGALAKLKVVSVSKPSFTMKGVLVGLVTRKSMTTMEVLSSVGTLLTFRIFSRVGRGSLTPPS